MTGDLHYCVYWLWYHGNTMFLFEQYCVMCNTMDFFQVFWCTIEYTIVHEYGIHGKYQSAMVLPSDAILFLKTFNWIYLKCFQK